MEKFEMYRCSTCKAVYNTAEEALNCENGHTEFRRSNVVPKYKPGEKVPHTLHVQYEGWVVPATYTLRTDFTDIKPQGVKD